MSKKAFTYKKNPVGPGWHIIGSHNREIAWIFDQENTEESNKADRERVELLTNYLNNHEQS